jgi:hypothetical protein
MINVCDYFLTKSVFAMIHLKSVILDILFGSVFSTLRALKSIALRVS